MPQPLSQAQAEALQSAFALLQQGQAEQALTMAVALAAQSPRAPDAQHLLAMSQARLGAFIQAEDAFRRALALVPGQSMILCNFAAMLRGIGRADDALKIARQAVRVSPQSTRAWWLVGLAATDMEALDIALEAFDTLVALSPDHLAARVHLSRVQRKLGLADEAVARLAPVMDHGGDDGALADAMAGALVDAGRAAEAITVARRATERYPGYVPAVMTLAQLLWEHAEAGEGSAAASLVFETQLARQPDHHALRLAFVRFLIDAREPRAAIAQLSLMRRNADDPSLALLEARAYDMLGELDVAGAIYLRLDMDGRETSPTFLNAFALHLLRARDPAQASVVAQRIVKTSPHDQHAWACLATAWRVLDDPRAHWLCDFETLIGIVDVDQPAEEPDRQTFLASLAATLEPLHHARREPMQQSLRGGSQTPGRLFGRNDPVLERARIMLLSAVERWLASLPKDRSHPFLGRNSGRVRMGGSWSVKLWSSGRHANHMHGEGWMSSAFYVRLPPSVLTGATEAGAIQFGQPPVELGLALPPSQVVRPRTGQLVLFPSYMWHGTVPFADETSRMTIAFDMLPLLEPS